MNNATGNKLAKTSFFVGLLLALFVRAAIFFVQKKTKARILLIQTKMVSAFLMAAIAFHLHIDSSWVKIQWWLDRFGLQCQIDGLNLQVIWKSFLSYWDGFGTGMGFGLLLGIFLMIQLRKAPK